MAIGYLAPLMLVPAGLTRRLPVLFRLLFILGFTDAWAVIAMQTYLAEAVPDHYEAGLRHLDRCGHPRRSSRIRARRVAHAAPRVPSVARPGRRPRRDRRTAPVGGHGGHRRDAP